MVAAQVESEAGLEREAGPGLVRLTAWGSWTVDTISALESRIPRALAGLRGRVILDLTRVDRIDTAGAWLVRRIGEQMRASGASVEEVGATDAARRLLAAVESAAHMRAPAQPRPRFSALAAIENLGRSMASGWDDFLQAILVLGAVARALGRSILRPSRFRITSIIFHVDRSGLQAIPIVFLMSFLIGGIIAQQGIFQLRQFGSTIFVVDLVGILVLREIGVLLTAIMLAGRSGSAYTAEIGSMKMREELDALTVIGLDPMEVLIMPRIVALVIALPLLTFVSDAAALIGGAVVALVYGNMSIQSFILQLRDAVGLNTLLVGIYKAPFMALIVGLIAANEGLAVTGSTESLGRRTTSSVVKAIFMVIVADGIFAVFFAAINY